MPALDYYYKKNLMRMMNTPQSVKAQLDPTDMAAKFQSIQAGRDWEATLQGQQMAADERRHSSILDLEKKQLGRAKTAELIGSGIGLLNIGGTVLDYRKAQQAQADRLKRDEEVKGIYQGYLNLQQSLFNNLKNISQGYGG